MTPQLTPISTALLNDPKQISDHLQSQRAIAGAREFEAALFSQVLEKMEKSLSIEDEQNNDAGHETWSALGVRAVSQALAQSHVLGIANMIERSLGLPPTLAAPALGPPPTMSLQENKSRIALTSLKLSPSLPIHTSEAAEETL